MNCKVGTRGSALAVVQTQNALNKLSQLFPYLNFELIKFATPGDRDQKVDLRDSPPDFFTRDLDQALCRGEIDIAVHSAKDLPVSMSPELDWFWLPWREDPRDAWILAQGRSMDDLPEYPVIGVSSERRDICALRRFPGAVLKPIRGSIIERLKQLDHGDFDAVIMAGAAFNRLELAHRITEWISLDQLCVPPGQGYLAVTFRSNDQRLRDLRRCFVKAVRFVGGGVGSADYCTYGGIKDIQSADLCLYDVLMDDALLQHLPAEAAKIFVGKRCGSHSVKQEEISALLSMYARQGKRVVRLKGGDPGLFGRLAEETAELDRLDLPYHVRAGVSALTAATTATGLLLTRRGVSRGFCVITPRAAQGEISGISLDVRAKLPLVLFMSVKIAPAMAGDLMDQGWPASTPAAVVFNAGADDQSVITFTLQSLRGNPPELESSFAPGLIIIGSAAETMFKAERGALRGCRVLLTCSESIMDKAIRCVMDFGGVPVARPMIRLLPCDLIKSRLMTLSDYEWVVITSPASVNLFMGMVHQIGVDLRSIPKIMTCGPGSANALRSHGITPDLTPPMVYSAEGLAEVISSQDFKGTRVLRLRSEKAGTLLADVLRQKGARVDDEILYHNEFIQYPEIPDYDIVFFASASAVESYIEQAGREPLQDKYILAIGKPTAAALQERGLHCDCIADKATVDGAIDTLARNFIARAYSHR